MAKQSYKERYHVEIKQARLNEEQKAYAKDLMTRALLVANPDDYFTEAKDNDDQSLHYVFRTKELGKEIQYRLDDESHMAEHGSVVWAYRHWVPAPDRRMIGLFIDTGIVGCVAPGDDFFTTSFRKADGEVVKGYFDNSIYPINEHLGNIVRLYFQGRSKEVWNARRRFRYELNNVNGEYGDIANALDKARTLLGDHAVIHVINDVGGVFSISAYGVAGSPFMSSYDLGEAFVHEYKLVDAGVPWDDIIRPDPETSTFEKLLVRAKAKNTIKRIGA